jgi:hypothetical protein
MKRDKGSPEPEEPKKAEDEGFTPAGTVGSSATIEEVA